MRGFIALAALIGAASPAFAAKTDFPACDGYPAPGKKSDGIVTSTWLFGLAKGHADYRRSQTEFGAAAAAACERALADPLLLPGQWLRRAHLLQAKGLHLIAAGDDTGALAALAASDATGAAGGDPLFAGSVGAGNRALRALISYRAKRVEEARAQLDEIERERPYAPSLKLLTRSIRLLHEGGLETFRAELQKAAPHDPDLLESLFRLSIIHGRFADSAPLHGQISHDLPRGRGGWQLEGGDDRKYALIPLRADLAGAAAYALTAEGKKEAAAAMAAAARDDIEDARTEPQPGSNGKIGKKAQADYVRRIQAADEAGQKLAVWEKTIALRELAPTKTLSEFVPMLDTTLSAGTPVFLDLVRATRAASATEKAEIEMASREIDAMIEKARRKEAALAFEDLARLLPRPETLQQKPSYKGAAPLWFESGNNGFYIKKQPGTAELNVGYGSDHAPAAMVEELGMLAAAMKARDAGKDSFLVQSRMMMQRTIHQYSYLYTSGPTHSYPAGHEVRLRILPVSAAALPEGLEAARWRLVDANEVYRQLYPKYAPAPKAKD